MVNFFICVVLSIMVSFGMAVAIVEKSNTWPIRRHRIRLQLLLRKIHWKLPQMLFCTTCTSFHTSLISDIIIGLIAYSHGIFYFFWPFSGFITCGITWFIVEFLNALDTKIED